MGRLAEPARRTPATRLMAIVTSAGGLAAFTVPLNGHRYVAPPGRLLLVGTDRRLLLSRLPPVHFCRTSGDRLFASIALSHGAQAIAVVLTGMGRDGADGAQRGQALVEPREAA